MALVVVAVAAAVVPAKGTKNERGTKKEKGGCEVGAAALYRRRPQSALDGGNKRRFPAPSVFTTAETERSLQTRL